MTNSPVLTRGLLSLLLGRPYKPRLRLIGLHFPLSTYSRCIQPLFHAFSQYTNRFLRGIGVALGWIVVMVVRFAVLPSIPAFQWLGVMMDITALLLCEIVEVMIEAIERDD